MEPISTCMQHGYARDGEHEQGYNYPKVASKFVRYESSISAYHYHTPGSVHARRGLCIYSVTDQLPLTTGWSVRRSPGCRQAGIIVAGARPLIVT